MPDSDDGYTRSDTSLQKTYILVLPSKVVSSNFANLVATDSTDGSANLNEASIFQALSAEFPSDTTAPVITGASGGPGATASAITINEGLSAVTTFTANEAVTWSLDGGADAASFRINPATGALTFVAAPGFENPTDAHPQGCPVTRQPEANRHKKGRQMPPFLCRLKIASDRSEFDRDPHRLGLDVIGHGHELPGHIKQRLAEAQILLGPSGGFLAVPVDFQRKRQHMGRHLIDLGDRLEPFGRGFRLAILPGPDRGIAHPERLCNLGERQFCLAAECPKQRGHRRCVTQIILHGRCVTTPQLLLRYGA